MFRFKQFLFILENRLDYFKGRQDLEFHDAIDKYAENADPTEEKMYVPRLLAWHKAGLIKTEDAPHLNDLLTDFHQQKQKLQKRDIGAYKTPSELEDAVAGYAGSLSGKAADERIKKEEVEPIHSENGVTISSPKTEAAACLLGKNTKWCTTWTGEKNMFNHYNNKGPLYVINIPQKDKPQMDENGKPKTDENGKSLPPIKQPPIKYQYHPADSEFRDAEDQSVNLNTVAMKHPEVATGLRKIGLGKDLAMNRTELENKLNTGTFSEKADLLSEHPLVEPKDITEALNDPRLPTYVKKAALTHPTAVTKEHIDQLIDKREAASSKDFIEHEAVVEHALRNSPAVTPEHITNILKGPDESIGRKGAAIRNRHGAVQSYHIDDVLEKHIDPEVNSYNRELRNAAMFSPAVESRHIDQVLDDPTEFDQVKVLALENKAVTPKQVTKVLNGDNETLKNTVIAHPTAVEPQHIDKFLADNYASNYTKRELFKNSPAIRPHHIDKIVNDYMDHGIGEIGLVNQALKTKATTPENIDNLLSKPSDSFNKIKIKEEAFKNSPAIESHHIDALLNDHNNWYENQSVISAALTHPTAVEPRHIDTVLNNSDLSDEHLKDAMESPALTSEHIGKILKNNDIYDYHKKDLLTHPKVLPSHIDYVLNNRDNLPQDVKRQALEHPTAVRSRHIDKLLERPYMNENLLRMAVTHPTAMKPRHMDKMLSTPDVPQNIIRNALNSYSKANAVLPRHITHILQNPDQYDGDVIDAAVNHPVTKQMASET